MEWIVLYYIILYYIVLDEGIRQAICFEVGCLEKFHSDRIAGRRSIGAMMIFVDQQSSESPVQLSANKESFLSANAAR
jgi:hypothetical protein